MDPTRRPQPSLLAPSPCPPESQLDLYLLYQQPALTLTLTLNPIFAAFAREKFTVITNRQPKMRVQHVTKFLGCNWFCMSLIADRPMRWLFPPDKLYFLTAGGAGDHRAGSASDASCDAQQVAAYVLFERRHRRRLLQPATVDPAAAAAARRHRRHCAHGTHPTVAR